MIVQTSRHAATITAGLALGLAAAWIVWLEINVLPFRVFGTPTVPHSDALGPWLHGAVNYAFLDQPVWYLYRPTIGIFFASLLSLHFDTRIIPAAFILITIVLLTSLLHRLPPRVNIALALWFAMTAYCYQTYFSNIAPWTLTIDFPAFCFTVIGTLLALRALEHKLPGQLIVAFATLGLAAAIRGPMLFGGLAVGLFALIAFRTHPRRLPLLIVSAIAFVAPFVVDVSIQRANNLVNNGILSLYCFFSDPAGYYTMECQSIYQSLRPTTAQVIKGYLAHISSGRGLYQFGNNLYFVAAYSVSALTVFLLPLSLVAAVASAATGLITKNFSGSSRRLAHAAIVILVLAALVHGFDGVRAGLGTGILLLVIFIAVPLLAWRRRSLWPGLLLGSFVACAIFIALIGLVLPRLIETFAFTLHLAVLLAAVEALKMPGFTAEDSSANSNDKPTIGIIIATIILLYSGNSLFDPPLKKTYLEQVHNRPAAIKISSDSRLDRSLYFLGDGKFIYTRFDQTAVGSVVRFSMLLGIDGRAAAFNNDSLFRPALLLPR